MVLLHNRINKAELKRKLQEETFTRRTISLYRYVEIDDPDVQVLDMRNHYEYEVGHFENAKHPDAGTFKEAIRVAVDSLSNEKDKKILLYCTGGIRCEKASAYFKHNHYSRSKIYNRIAGPVDSIKP